MIVKRGIDNMMSVKKYGRLYQLTFLPNIFPVNCYLYEEDKDLTLIDAALPFSAKGILKTADQIGKPIKRIVLTHAHDDHVGALDLLKEALPEAKVYISKRDARLLDGDKSLDQGEPDTPIKGGVPKKLKTRQDITLTEGDQIGSLTAIDAPGHTPGSMAFFAKDGGVLIAGDAFQTQAGMAVAGKPRFWFPFPAFGTWNKEKSIETAEKLMNLKPSILAVGHGKVLEGPLELMKIAIAEAKK